MNTIKFEYDAIKVQQSKTSKPLILFGANALEIDQWSGIPQKKSFIPGAAESSGFQRTENKKRIKSLSAFYLNQENVVQNSLICGLRKVKGARVEFKEQKNSLMGTLVIEFPDLYNATWKELFGLLRESLETRLNRSSEVDKTSSEYNKLKLKLNVFPENAVIEGGDEFIEETEINDEGEDNSALFEESHINDFLNEVAMRHEILKEFEEDFELENTVMGFDKDSILSFLLPVVLVDGQHRLKGAVESAKVLVEQNDDEAMQLVDEGTDPKNINNILMRKYARFLPVSLLLESEPKEQVFQFVVINQKATPISKSLLGTIISTTLTSEEMESVQSRLEHSGIALDDARAVTWASLNSASPFYNLVNRGIDTGQKGDLLDWNVMGELIKVFRRLSGGKLYHAPKLDWARNWKDKYLADSNIVNDSDPVKAFEEWSSLKGPWTGVFLEFWHQVKDKLAQVENSDRHNFWGNPRGSNVFNKITLNILAADFFKFLVNRKLKIDCSSDISLLVQEWLEDVNLSYFDRDWQLSGIKKDSTGIRARWAKNWNEYRESPTQLPHVKSFRDPLSI
ncbi:MAG: hypothetical protein IBX55_15995 [Methyloprofundus sp.]|nr:hypothetical protein [Methyloprofundus sp.]